MVGIILSLVACVTWGSADFLGGLKCRSMPVLVVLLGMELAGVIIVIAALMVFGGPIPEARYLWFAVAAGSVGITGLGCVYRGMAVGTIGIVSVIGSASAILPVSFDLMQGNRLNLYQTLGIVLAISGIAFISMEKMSVKEKKRFMAGLGFGSAGAVLTGFAFIFTDLACEGDPYWATLFARFTIISMVSVALYIQRPIFRVKKSDISVLVSIGVLDTVGVIAFAVATTMGFISIISVLSSLYPVVAILLAKAFLDERLSKIQMMGVTIALGGIVLISGG
ncbi:MAG: DMT family transporter [Desulfobacterales bacterium]|nr:DMT family transporter [Desulfobacterales bacterium]